MQAEQGCTLRKLCGYVAGSRPDLRRAHTPDCSVNARLHQRELAGTAACAGKPSKVSKNPRLADTQQPQASSAAPPLQLTVEAALGGRLPSNSPCQGAECQSLPGQRHRAAAPGTCAVHHEGHDVFLPVQQNPAWQQKSAGRPLDSKVAAATAGQHHAEAEQYSKAAADCNQYLGDAVHQQPTCTGYCQTCHSDKLLDDMRQCGPCLACCSNHSPSCADDEQEDPLTLQYQPVSCHQEVYADRPPHIRSAERPYSSRLLKRGRWRKRNHKKDGVIDLWARAGLPLHTVQQKTS